MSKKKKSAKIPSMIDILMSMRVQIETPKGGAHEDKTKYNRKEKHPKDLREE